MKLRTCTNVVARGHVFFQITTLELRFDDEPRTRSAHDTDAIALLGFGFKLCRLLLTFQAHHAFHPQHTYSRRRVVLLTSISSPLTFHGHKDGEWTRASPCNHTQHHISIYLGPNRSPSTTHASQGKHKYVRTVPFSSIPSHFHFTRRLSALGFIFAPLRGPLL